MKPSTGHFFTLIQLSLGYGSPVDFPVLDAQAWDDIFRLSRKHTVMGLLMGAIDILPPDCLPPFKMKMKWLGKTACMTNRNVRFDRSCSEITALLESVGLENRILKGQGIARYYPQPEYRTCGDIDVWVRPKGITFKNEFEKVRRICSEIDSLEQGRVENVNYHHGDWNYGNIHVEIHFRPVYMMNPRHNRRFQSWADAQFDSFESSAEGFNCPSLEFNLTYVLLHIYHHLLFEGVGLRHVADYAVVLKALDSLKESNPQTASQIRENTLRTIENLHMEKFTCGLMWVLRTVCGISDELMLMPADEKTGKVMFETIMRGGNMGHSMGRAKNSISKAWKRTRHRMRFLLLFPSEILWDIPFRLWHWTWRKRYNMGR